MTLGDLPIGSIVTDKKTKFNGKPIEWLVADHTKYEVTVLLSRGILCCRPFDNPKESYKDMNCREYGSNNWRDSDIRKWLETEFYRKLFSSRLAGLTIPVLNAPEIPMRDRGNRNEHIDNTEDNVFLLSAAEIGSEGDSKAIELFKSNNKEKNRIAEVCPGLTWYWWLRSPLAGHSYNTRVVCTDGSLYYNYAYYDHIGVRPACVISSSAPVKIRKSGGYKFDWKEVIE